MYDAGRILKQFADQAVACETLGSPFTAMLCRLLAARLDVSTRFGRRILEWPTDPYADNIALRATGALHALARSGWEPGLQSVYPPNAVSEHTLWIAIADALGHHDNFLADRLSSAPQTNEVARSGLILGAMLQVASLTRLPLEIFEIGASAGLNLSFDRYGYTLGEGRMWGAPDAPLTIECPWRGRIPPLDAPLSVVGRQGCDLNPLEPDNPADRERLLSYVWPDQAHRLQRTDAALRFAAARHQGVDRADAADWLEHKLGAPPRPGVARVLVHTIVLQYLPAQVRARIEALLVRTGAAATYDTPLARFAFEQDEVPGSGRMSLTLWPTGTTIILGRGDFHGRWAEWA
ncbi:MAG: DUF2332 family protein [Devosia nanyangense]|uniref:DUF2332 family protein n=1 Tax=Devosia nanyangense TaxID=1228055 RepID=A0A933L483_9HYPH|nr:DUF2332 family protein [Devosia nanyangense]